jgi:heme exporter protein D
MLGLSAAPCRVVPCCVSPSPGFGEASTLKGFAMMSDPDVWYLWLAFDATFLVLAIEVAITVGATRKQQRRHAIIQHPAREAAKHG